MSVCELQNRPHARHARTVVALDVGVLVARVRTTDVGVEVNGPWIPQWSRVTLVGDNKLDVEHRSHPNGPGFELVRWIEIDLTCFLRNVAIAGGLAQAWRLGQENGIQWFAGRVVRRNGPP